LFSHSSGFHSILALSLYDMMARTKVGWQNSLPSLMELWMRAVMDLILLCDGTKVFFGPKRVHRKAPGVNDELDAF